MAAIWPQSLFSQREDEPQWPVTSIAQTVDLGGVREALQAAKGLAIICASIDCYSREELATSGRAMRQQFAEALALIDSQALGNGETRPVRPLELPEWTSLRPVHDAVPRFQQVSLQSRALRQGQPLHR